MGMRRKAPTELDPLAVNVSTRLFARLLQGHGRRLTESGASSQDGFAAILEGFKERRTSAAIGPTDAIAQLLEGHARALGELDSRQAATADDFNLMEVLRLTGNENRHSMVLAWLLDRNVRKHGTHAQGSLGLRLFLEEVGLPIALADGPYWVRREVAGDESRVDVEIAARGRFLIHIENKIWSGEGNRQTDREWSDVQRRASSLGISLRDGKVWALFLTPEGIAPTNLAFKAISWRQVARALDSFAARAQPTDVRLFAAHYAKALRMFVVSEEQEV